MVELDQKSNSPTKTCVHPQKIMICIWWNNEGVLYYELLPRGVTITNDIYCQHQKSLAGAKKKKRPERLREVMLFHDKARPHSDNLTKTLYRSWVRKSLCTHLMQLILRPQIFSFSALHRPTFKELPFRMEMCSEHGLTTC